MRWLSFQDQQSSKPAARATATNSMLRSPAATIGRVADQRLIVNCMVRSPGFFSRPLVRLVAGVDSPKLRLFMRETSSKPSRPRTSVSRARFLKDADVVGCIDAEAKSQAIRAKSPIPDLKLHENIYTLPNILTFSRLVAAPLIGYFVLQDSHAWAAGLLAYAGVTDVLDGWIARHWNQKTVLGTVIDPMADKVLMTILTLCLAIKGALPVWLASIILGRDIGLGIAAIYFRWISLPCPKTFARYWDFSLPSAEVRPTTISKYNTFMQLALVGVTTAAPIVSLDLAQTLTVMQFAVAATTIWSGASYVYTKDAVKILNAPNKTKSKQ